MKIDTKTLLLLAGVGLLGWALLKRSQPDPRNWQQYLPPQPPPPSQGGNAQEWQQWINLAMNTFGQVASLWQPGGPFYNQPDAPPFTPGFPDPNSPLV